MNSYIQIELGGKMRGLKFNQLAYEELLKKLPQDEKNKFDWSFSNSVWVYACIYAGLVGNAYVKGEVVDFTFEDVTDWIEDAKTEDVQAAWKIFEDSQHYKKMLDKFNEQIRSLAGTEEKKSEVVT